MLLTLTRGGGRRGVFVNLVEPFAERCNKALAGRDSRSAPVAVHYYNRLAERPLVVAVLVAAVLVLCFVQSLMMGFDIDHKNVALAGFDLARY